MSTKRPLEAQRQKNDRLAGGKVACSIVFDKTFREMSDVPTTKPNRGTRGKFGFRKLHL